jgi:uncharacterized metal-binding protein
MWGSDMDAYPTAKNSPASYAKENTTFTLKDHIRNTEIRRKTQMKDAAITAQIMKWRWAGHAVSLDHRRWAHATTL